MRVIRLILLTLIVTACQSKQSDNTVSIANNEVLPITQQAVSAPPPPKPRSQINDKQEKQENKIIKDGRITLKVTELKKTKTHVDLLVKKNRGYYANESLTNADYESTYHLTIRIPASNFEKLISEIESGRGEILYKEIDARDVTEQFIDLETRLKNKKSYLERYNTLLNRANTISEILEVEEKIRILEEEIESTMGRLKYLRNKMDYSTLNLIITKQKDFKYSPETRGKFSERIKQSLSKGWISFVVFSLFILKLWPFWIVIFLILYFWRKHKQRKKNRQYSND